MNPDPYQGIWGGAHCRDSPVQTDRKCDCDTDYCRAGDLYYKQVTRYVNEFLKIF